MSLPEATLSAYPFLRRPATADVAPPTRVVPTIPSFAYITLMPPPPDEGHEQFLRDAQAAMRLPMSRLEIGLKNTNYDLTLVDVFLLGLCYSAAAKAAYNNMRDGIGPPYAYVGEEVKRREKENRRTAVAWGYGSQKLLALPSMLDD